MNFKFCVNFENIIIKNAIQRRHFKSASFKDLAASADGKKLEDKLTDQASQAGQLWYPHAQTLDKGSDSRKTDRLLTKEQILFLPESTNV